MAIQIRAARRIKTSGQDCESASPTFALPPCPQCSSVVALDRPYWRYAHNTSRARQKNCYIFTGCQHADALGKLLVLGTPKEWATIEEQWAKRCAELFAAKTEKYKPDVAARFKRALDEENFIPGAVAELDFKTDDPQTKHIAFVTDAERPF